MALNRKKSLYLVDEKDSNAEGREFVVTFPNTGEMMNIELLKIQLSDGKFDTLKFSYNEMFIQQAIRIEAIATFSILLPTLKEALNVKSFLALDYEHAEIITKMYIDQFLPWYEEWLVLLNKPKEEEKKEEVKA